jgi:hypothetical protein
MKETYFSAIALVEKPFVTFNSIGYFTPAEFAASPYSSDPLVIKESDVPDYAFGVCTAKIVAGELVNRTAGEMAVFETEYNIIIGVKSEAARIDSINASSFTYDGKDFPMDAVSRIFYDTLAVVIPAVSKIRTMTNEAYTLADVDVPAFITAYRTKLLLISKHTL